MLRYLRSFSHRFSEQRFVCFFFSYPVATAFADHKYIFWFSYADNVRWTVEVLKILITWPSPPSHHFLAHKYKHVLENLQSLFAKISISCYRASYNDKWEHQLDATIKYIFHLKLVSTCFGRDITHHQEITQLYISANGNIPFKAWKDGIVEIK